jgi:hypothetical protein
MGVLGGLRPANTPFFLSHPGNSQRDKNCSTLLIRNCGTILTGVKLDLRGNSAADPFMGGGFFCSPAACRREK